jgi:hypothetical protein
MISSLFSWSSLYATQFFLATIWFGLENKSKKLNYLPMTFDYCYACYKFMATWFFGGFRCQLIQNTHTVKPPKYKHHHKDI